MRQPHVDAGRAVDAGDIVVAVGAVDVGGQRAAGGVGLRVLEQRRSGAGHQVHQVLIVPVLIQRQVRDVLRPEVDADVSLVGLEQDGFGRDRDRLGQRADFELAVDAHDAASSDRDARLHELLEPLQRCLQRVHAAGDVPDRVGAGRVGRRPQLESRVLVLDRDGRARDGARLRYRRWFRSGSHRAPARQQDEAATQSQRQPPRVLSAAGKRSTERSLTQPSTRSRMSPPVEHRAERTSRSVLEKRTPTVLQCGSGNTWCVPGAEA